MNRAEIQTLIASSSIPKNPFQFGQETDFLHDFVNNFGVCESHIIRLVAKNCENFAWELELVNPFPTIIFRDRLIKSINFISNFLS